MAAKGTNLQEVMLKDGSRNRGHLDVELENGNTGGKPSGGQAGGLQ